MEDNQEIKKEFSHRLKPHSIVLGFLFFVPCSILILWRAYSYQCHPDLSSGDCSLGYQGGIYFKWFMTAFGVTGLGLPFIGLYRRIKSNIDSKGSRVAFTDQYIIGPSSGIFNFKETRVYYRDIKDFNIKANQYRHHILEIISDNVNLTIMNQLLGGDDFEEIYNELKIRMTRAELINKERIEEIQTFQERKQIVNAMTYMFVIIGYLAFCLVPLFVLEGYRYKQIESMDFIEIGFLLNIFFLSILIYILQFLNKPELISQYRGGLVMIGLGFLIGMLSMVSILSFANQIGDSSKTYEVITTLVRDDRQSKNDIYKNGICYKLKKLKDSERNFGEGDICEGESFELSEQKEVLVRYRYGNLGRKWFVDFRLK